MLIRNPLAPGVSNKTCMHTHILTHTHTHKHMLATQAVRVAAAQSMPQSEEAYSTMLVRTHDVSPEVNEEQIFVRTIIQVQAVTK